VIERDGLVADSNRSYRAWVVTTPLAGIAFSVATVFFELAGPLMLVGRRTRICVAAGLFGMHANIFLLTGILYWESIVLLILFALSPDPAAEVVSGPASRVSAWGYRAAVAVLGLCAVLAIGHQARRYARANAVAPVVAPSPPAGVATPALRQIGPFAVGQTIAGSWSIDMLDLSDGGFIVATAKSGARARFELTCASVATQQPVRSRRSACLLLQQSGFRAARASRPRRAGSAARCHLRR
jgi:hypothetical protein